MHAPDPRLIRSRGPPEEAVVRLGLPLVDDYPGFLDGRCRPNTVLAAAYDLEVFFGMIGKPPGEGGPADVLGSITAQRGGGSDGSLVQPVDVSEPHGATTSMVARRLSIVSGFFACLQARGDIASNPLPRGCQHGENAAGRIRECR